MNETNQNQTTPGVAINLLSKDAILGANDSRTEVVHVPEWGGSVTVCSMTGAQRDAFEATLHEMKINEKGEEAPVRNMENFRARICAATMINANGKLLFPNPEDVRKLGEKSSRALDRVMKVAQRLNGIGAQDVEQLTKN